MTDEEKQAPRDRAQALSDRAYAQVLLAIKNVEAIEKIACAAKDNEAIIAASEVIRALRKVKELGLKHNGKLGGVVIQGGGT